MVKQIVFALALLSTFIFFGYTISRYVAYFKLTKKGFPVKDIGKRISRMLEVAFGQTKIFRWPVIGFLHAIVFWGFCVILIGSIEMVIDGLFGTERAMGVLGDVYNVITASGDVFAFLIAIAIIIFMIRREILNVKRFNGPEMKEESHKDASFALTMILLLMISLLGMNAFYVALMKVEGSAVHGVYPVSDLIASLFSGSGHDSLFLVHEVFWWMHILLIFVFANVLPYSKHFHVFLSVPNVFLSNLNPMGKMRNMENIMAEVKMMMNPETAFSTTATDAPVERFGAKDADDLIWKHYFDSLTCTECGRCTSVCPANTTGKKLSPRKIMMDLRARMKEKGSGILKNGKDYNDNRSLLRDYISEEELWACTTCNACATECPVNINQPAVILEMRRYLVMEEASAPGELKNMFNYTENNGAPWQYSAEERMTWAKDLEMKVKA